MAGGQAVGHKIFSKQITATDLDHGLHWPSEYLAALPDFNGGHHVDFTAKDADGKVWSFRCSKRAKGPYRKPVVSGGWVLFLRSKGQLAAGDDAFFYSSVDPTVHFAVRFNTKVMLFGSNVGSNEKKKHNMEGLMYTFTLVDENARQVELTGISYVT